MYNWAVFIYTVYIIPYIHLYIANNQGFGHCSLEEMPKLGRLVSLDSLVIHDFRRVWGVYLGITSTSRTSCLLERLEHEITWEKKD